MTEEQLVAPFSLFGGKRRSVNIVWPRLGADVSSYLEPFAGTLAMLLGRPGGAGKYETVNDANSLLSNFWRSVRADPTEVARYADYPIIEIDLHARHQHLVDAIPKLSEKLERDPHYFDPKLAGFWVWGKCAWIGNGWCDPPRDSNVRVAKRLPEIQVVRGVHSVGKQLPDISSRRGVHKKSAGGIYDVMMALAERLRHVRVCSGDWQRILSPSSMGTNPSGLAQGIAPCAIYLDPPYLGYEHVYGIDNEGLHDRILEFCLEYGNNPRVRIALSGYEGEYELPGWDVVPWKAHGGYANQNKNGDNDNAHKERIWFSPFCIKPVRELTMSDLFARTTSVSEEAEPS